MLNDESHRSFFFVNDVLAIATVVSIVAIVLETVPSLAQYKSVFDLIELVTVAIFTAEYVGRLYVARPKLSYVFSFFGLVDLISILPSYLGVGNLTFLKTARSLRIIRLLRVLRMVKLTRSSKRVKSNLGLYSLNAFIFLATFGFALIIAGSAVYVAEPNSPAFASIPLGMVWALKVFLIGIPVEYPTTTGGQIAHMLTRFLGLVVFGVLIGIVGKYLEQALYGKK